MKKIDWSMVILDSTFAILMIAALGVIGFWTVENKLYIVDFSQSIDWGGVMVFASAVYFCVTLAFLCREIGREVSCPAMN